MLMKFNVKAKSFHVMVRGNFPAARVFAEPDTYTTTRGQVVGKGSHRKNSRNPQQNNHLNHLTINRPSTGHQNIESMTISLSDPSSESLP